MRDGLYRHGFYYYYVVNRYRTTACKTLKQVIRGSRVQSDKHLKSVNPILLIPKELM